ncbi:condensation domain-containing protein [Actinoplanes sp. NPDC026619]|uniref:condensation domain-containing protein n=1 Tax=Actinoplanes sp. NPDC026619 TaxID=3155798 RepID=UPI0033C67D73
MMHDTIADIVRYAWQVVLDQEFVHDQDRFLDKGGDSLSAVRIAVRIHRELAVDISIETVLTAKTLGGLIAWAEHSTEVDAPPAITARGIAGIHDVSPQLERKLHIAQQDHVKKRQIVAVALELTGCLDIAALTGAVNAVVDRHTMLSCRFGMSDDGPFAIYDPDARVRLEVLHLPDLRDAGRLEAAVAEASVKDFDIWRGPLGRIQLFVASPDRAVLLIAVDHIAFDGWSTRIAVRDFAAAYREARSTGTALREPMEHTISDFARWHRQILDGPRGAALRSFWRNYLAGTDAMYNFSQFRRFTRSAKNYQGAWSVAELSAESSERIRKLASVIDVTTYSIWASIFLLVARSLLETEDVAVHTSTANRATTEMEDMVGYLSHGLILRSVVSGDPSFTSYAQANNLSFLSAYGHQELTSADVAKMLWPDRYIESPNLSSIYFDVGMPQSEAYFSEDLIAAPVSLPPSFVDFGLFGFLTDGPDGRAVFRILYNHEFMSADTARSVLMWWLNIARQVARSPDARLSELLAQAGGVPREIRAC